MSRNIFRLPFAAIVLLLTACTSYTPVTTMSDQHFDELKKFVLSNQTNEVLPTGWRELSGEEIRLQMVGKNFAGHQIQMKRNRRFIYEIKGNGIMYRGLGEYFRSECSWSIDEHSIFFDCPEVYHRWFVFTNGNDLVAMRIFDGRRYFNILEEIAFQRS
ncbi:hypothetical protein [Thalassospira lucentensis]|mgnify:CR=1 FL=1|uniref:Lipoprotein n=1 Tax=Thalassospira lucentensis TaxID=168935 RepID=A0A358HZW6_9PROT|nr:hypothetical protein [Thalassospira lucentensis]HBV00726.1 hypothetical protein [Thalassospira lucentensis]HCW69172.1 hypothetical protein [Thalassospira lucentensis]